jgi:hypothetical protein
MDPSGSDDSFVSIRGWMACTPTCDKHPFKRYGSAAAPIHLSPLNSTQHRSVCLSVSVRERAVFLDQL